MRNRFFGLFVLLSVMVVSAANGQVILPPGSQATLTANPAHGGSATNNGNHGLFVLASDYDLDAKTLKAKATVGNSTIGTGIARAQLFYEFTVPATPTTNGNTVGAWVSYVVDWRGFQAIAGVGSTNSDVEVNIVLRDLTESRNLRAEPVHSLDLATQKVKYVTLGLTLNDESLKADTFPAVLKRGNTYRITLSMATTLSAISTVAIGRCDYMDAIFGDPRGVQLHSLFVKVGLDEREVLQILNSFQDHRHVYLTGRGTGHNNVEAESSLPVIDKPAPKLFVQTLQNEDGPLSTEPVQTGKSIFEKP